MKILFYNDFLKQIGGTEVYQHRLVAALRRMDHEVEEVFATGKDYPRSELLFKLWCLWGSIFSNRTLESQIRQKIRRFRPEVIHVNNNKIYLPLIYKIADQFKIPVVTAFHDFHLLQEEGTIFWKSVWKKRNLRIVKEGSVVFLSLTQIIAKSLERNNCYPIRYIPLFIDREDWYPSEDKIRGNNIVYFGRIERGKGVFLLLQSFGILVKKGWDLHLQYMGSGTHARELEEEIINLGLSNRVTLLGKLPQGKLLSILQAARMAVVPTLTEEPFGMTGIEAQAAGIPVVAAKVGGIPEWCIDGETGLLFKGGDQEDLAQKMEVLLKDSALEDELIHGALERVHKEFQKESVLQKTLALYRDIS